MELEEIKTKLKRFIASDILNDPDYPVRDDEPLITSGLMDSFALAQIGVFAEIEFDLYIPDPELTVDRMNTVEDMATRIMEKLK